MRAMKAVLLPNEANLGSARSSANQNRGDFRYFERVPLNSSFLAGQVSCGVKKRPTTKGGGTVTLRYSQQKHCSASIVSQRLPRNPAPEFRDAGVGKWILLVPEVSQPWYYRDQPQGVVR